MNPALKKLKPIIILILIFFTTTFLKLDLLAAVNDNSGQFAQKDKTTAGKFQATLEEIEKLLEDISEKLDCNEDVSPHLNELQVIKQKIEDLNQQIQQEFIQTEQKLKAAGISADIFQRHYDFVESYNQKLSSLLANLKEVEDTKTDKIKQKGKINQSKEYIKNNKYKNHKKKQRITDKPIHKLKKLKQAPQQGEQVSLNQPSKKTTLIANVPSAKPSNLLSRLFSFLAGKFISPAEATPPPYTEYLGQSIEVQFTQEIIDLAASLDNNPVKIYEFVRNNFNYEVYYGSLKGAVGTLHDRAGNDFDQASLLIALLRTSGIPAKYVYGRVEIPIERAKAWLGLDDPRRAGDILVTYGVPAITIISGGQPSAVSIEHCWVKAFVDYIPSGGAVHKQGDTWIPLDPSFKLQETYEPDDISGQVSFDADSYLSQVQTGDALDFYMDQLETYLEQNMPDKNLSQMGKVEMNVSESLGVLPASLPYQKISTISDYAEIPNDKRYQIKVTLSGDGFYIQDMIYQASFPEITGKRLTLSYTGAQSPYTNPAYTVTLQPTIKLDGTVQVTGDAIGAGREQLMTIDLIMPNQGTDKIQNYITAGEFHTLVATWPSSNGQAMMEMSKRLNQNITDIGDAFLDDDGFLKEDLTGDFLSLRGRSWFAQVGISKELASSFLHLPMYQDIGYADVSVKVKVEYLFGMPYTMTLSGLMIDADRNMSAVVPKTGEEWKQKEYATLTGYAASAMEHFIWEQKYEPGAVSAVKAIQLANEQGITVYDIDAANKNIIDTLAISDTAKEDMRNAINKGHVIKTPAQNISQAGWTGIGYIVQDPVTGDGTYKIGGASGGFIWYGTATKVTYEKFAFVGVEKVNMHADHGAIFSGLKLNHARKVAKYIAQLDYLVLYGQPASILSLQYNVRMAPFSIFYFIGHGKEYDQGSGQEMEGRAMLVKDWKTLGPDHLPVSHIQEWMVTAPRYTNISGEAHVVQVPGPLQVVFMNGCASSKRRDWADFFGIDVSSTGINSQAFIGSDVNVSIGGAVSAGVQFWKYLAKNPTATIYDALNNLDGTNYIPPYNNWFNPSDPYWDFRP